MSQPSSPKNSTTVRSQNVVRLARAVLQTAYVVSDELGTSLAERLFTSPRRHPRPDREKAVLADARPFDVTVHRRSPRWQGGTTRVAAWRWGYGPAVLLVHGWEGRGSQLGAFVAPLVEAGLSVVAFDAPGHGDSPGRRLYLTDLADTIVDVAEASGHIHAVIAHSFGAPGVLLAHSRGGFDAARNVMIAPNVIVDDAIDRFVRTVALDDAERAHFESHLGASAGLPVEALALDRLVGRRESSLLVIHDPADREVPFHHAETLAATWPRATLRAPTGLGHNRILRDPAVIAAAVDHVRRGVQPPASDLVRELDRLLGD